MKRLLLFISIACLLFTASGKAQITITSSDFPGIGYLVVSAVDNVTPVDPGQPGTNQVWDFSNLVPVTYDSTYYLSPDGLPNSWDYPDANIATNHNPGSYPNGGYNVNYHKITDQGYAGIGDESLVNIWGDLYFAFHIKYSPTVYHLTFPCTYGTTGSYNFILTWITGIRAGGATTDSSMVVSHYSASWQADASGTMVLPDGSFPVLRIKSDVTTIDTGYVWTNGSWVYDSDTTSTFSTYTWFANDYGQVGLYMPDGTRENSFTFFKSETLVGYEEIAKDSKLTIYPNPATSTIRILSDESVDLVEVYDITGRIFNITRNQTTIDISKLPSGFYLVKILQGNRSSIQKFHKL